VDPVIGISLALVLGSVVVYRNRRIAPDVPRRWRSSQSVAARLCRRLHRSVDAADVAVQKARKRGASVVMFESAIGDLRACATAIDHRLVTASELPLSSRHRCLLELRYRIIDVERAATRVVRMAGEAGRPDVEELRAHVSDVNARLDRLEESRRELREFG
jgi:hypothetical protein